MTQNTAILYLNEMLLKAYIVLAYFKRREKKYNLSICMHIRTKYNKFMYVYIHYEMLLVDSN